jgi:hypothetical protein
MPLTAEQRKLRAQIAAHTSGARTDDRPARTGKARKAFNNRFEREVDPDGKLSPAERAKRAENARKAYFARLALTCVDAENRTKAHNPHKTCRYSTAANTSRQPYGKPHTPPGPPRAHHGKPNTLT